MERPVRKVPDPKKERRAGILAEIASKRQGKDSKAVHSQENSSAVSNLLSLASAIPLPETKPPAGAAMEGTNSKELEDWQSPLPASKLPPDSEDGASELHSSKSEQPVRPAAPLQALEETMPVDDCGSPPQKHSTLVNKPRRLKKAGDVDRDNAAKSARPEPATKQPLAAALDLVAGLSSLELGSPNATASQAEPWQQTSENSPGADALLSLPRSSSLHQPEEDLTGVDDEAADGEGEGTPLVLGEQGEFRLQHSVSGRLYQHQLEGVAWLWKLHVLGKGGILADDMGLGKTMQCSAFLAGVLNSKLIRRAIVVAPKTLLAHWAKELEVCGLGSVVHEYFGSSQSEREHALRQVLARRGVLLTTYGMVLHNSQALSAPPRWGFGRRRGGGGGGEAEDDEDGDDEAPLWDFMILDEGHKVKNPKTQLSQHLREIPVRVRVIISGTPIQNNLMELHALFDFVNEGLLGDARTFKREFDGRINAGNDRNATGRERQIGAAKSAELRAATAPYFLRREKKDILSKMAGCGEGEAGKGAARGGPPAPEAMGRKNDFIVWLSLKPMQQRIYEAFLSSDAVKKALNKTGSALAALTVLKKICDHPALLSESAARLVAAGGHKRAHVAKATASDDDFIDDGSEEEYETAGSDASGSDDDDSFRPKQKLAGKQKGKGKAKQEAMARVPLEALEGGEGEDGDWWGAVGESGIESQLIEELHEKGAEASCKTGFVVGLLEGLVADGHRTLVFSQSRVMLDILQGAVQSRGWAHERIDGSVASIAERQARVQRFQTCPDIPIFLLTSHVGGLGLTLTAADRVVVVDPSWNPSTDNQSVDRAYRIGQRRDVVVYRLITCGTVEEKIYRKQVFKGGLSRSGTEKGNHFRYFSKQELRDLFRVDPEELRRSATQAQLHDLHAAQRVASPELLAHLAFLEGLEGYTGVSDHDLLFSKEDAEEVEAGWEEEGFARPPPHRAADLEPRQPGFQAGNRGGGGAAARRGAADDAGWQGAGELSDMLAASLSLGGASKPAPPAQGDVFAASVAREQARLREQIRKDEALLSQMGPRLPDAGAKLRASIDRLRAQLAESAPVHPAASGSSAGARDDVIDLASEDAAGPSRFGGAFRPGIAAVQSGGTGDRSTGAGGGTAGAAQARGWGMEVGRSGSGSAWGAASASQSKITSFLKPRASEAAHGRLAGLGGFPGRVFGESLEPGTSSRDRDPPALAAAPSTMASGLSARDEGPSGRPADGERRGNEGLAHADAPAAAGAGPRRDALEVPLEHVSSESAAAAEAAEHGGSGSAGPGDGASAAEPRDSNSGLGGARGMEQGASAQGDVLAEARARAKEAKRKLKHYATMLQGMGPPSEASSQQEVEAYGKVQRKVKQYDALYRGAKTELAALQSAS